MADRILLKLAAMRGELVRYPWQAVSRILKAMQLEQAEAGSDKSLPIQIFYRSNPHLSFAPREIDAFEVQQTKHKVQLDLTMNFLGLQGASTPLPIHFSETIVQDDPQDSSLNEFYNFFNQRVYTMLYEIEQKYAYLPQMTGDYSDALTQKIGSFAGFMGKKKSETTLLPYLHSLLGTNLAKGNWCRMIAGLFSCDQAWVKERVPTRLKIPNESLGVLGENSTLGETLSLGTYITQAKNHLELNLNIQRLEDYLPNQERFSQLKSFVKETMRENMFVSVRLHAQEASTLALRNKNPVALGWSSMLGVRPVEAYSVCLHLY